MTSTETLQNKENISMDNKNRKRTLIASNQNVSDSQPSKKKLRLNDKNDAESKQEIDLELDQKEESVNHTEPPKTNEPKFTAEQLQKKKTAELKELCDSRGLKRGGSKKVLLARLLNPKPMDFKANRARAVPVKEVNRILTDLGVEDTEKVNPCLKDAIKRKFVDLSADGLDTVVVSDGKCLCCSKTLTATVRDCLYQQPYGGGDYGPGGDGGAVWCRNCGGLDGEDVNWYVTGLCRGDAQIESGKFHNHCTECPGFGKCIGDYREAHCSVCNKHWFAGSGGQFPCTNCNPSAMDHFF